MFNKTYNYQDIVKNLIAGTVLQRHAEAIAKEIQKASVAVNLEELLSMKLERLLVEVDNKLKDLKSVLLKWNLIGLITQILIAVYCVN